MPGQRFFFGYGCRRIANGETCKFEPYPKTDMEKVAEQVQAIREKLERKMEPLVKFLNDKLQEAAEQVNKAYENARRKK
jgi:ABC-type Zn uptake system ZnuABC Zn-binding protein ZnuA